MACCVIVLALILIGCGEETTKVPNVEGQSEQSASAELRANGFEVKVDRAGIPTYVKGRVVGTAPTAGEDAEDGGAVTMILGEP